MTGPGSQVSKTLSKTHLLFINNPLELHINKNLFSFNNIYTVLFLSVSTGLSCEKKVKGKMDVYLQRYRPEHYAKLLSAHIL